MIGLQPSGPYWRGYYELLGRDMLDPDVDKIERFLEAEVFADSPQEALTKIADCFDGTIPTTID